MNSVVAEATGVGEFQVRIDTGEHSFVMDEPLEYGGLGSGPNPFDMMCAAIAACTLMTMRLYAKRKGWTLGTLRVRVAHSRGVSGARDRFDRTLELGDVTPEQREGLVRIAQRCPVHLLLERGADLTDAVAETALPAAQSDTEHAPEMEEICKDAG
jgi:putative redox protein